MDFGAFAESACVHACGTLLLLGDTATASVNSRLLALSRAADFVTYIRNLPVRSRFSEAALRLADDSAVRGTNHPFPVVCKRLTS